MKTDDTLASTRCSLSQHTIDGRERRKLGASLLSATSGLHEKSESDFDRQGITLFCVR